VIIPPGTWKGDDGMVVVGPKTITVKTPISRIPYFEKVK
jgi:alpha-glucosidase